MSEIKNILGEETGIPPLVIKLMVGIALLLIVFSFGILLAAVFIDHEKFKPINYSIEYMLTIGLSIFAGVYVPWTRIKIGAFELEKALEEQNHDYIQEIKSLKDRLRLHENEDAGEDAELKNLIVSFLAEYSRWGFTVSRMKNWGASKKGFSDLKDSSLRVKLGELVDERKIRTRISKLGNVLYQAN